MNKKSIALLVSLDVILVALIVATGLWWPQVATILLVALVIDLIALAIAKMIGGRHE